MASIFFRVHGNGERCRGLRSIVYPLFSLSVDISVDLVFGLCGAIERAEGLQLVWSSPFESCYGRELLGLYDYGVSECFNEKGFNGSAVMSGCDQRLQLSLGVWCALGIVCLV